MSSMVCFNRKTSLASSATASPVSGHQMSWADLSDGDEDSLSDWGEELLLGAATAESEKLLGIAPQETGDVIDQHQATQANTSTLNAYAAEFLPTLSMSCPLVGFCEVILEGDEIQGELQADPNRFWKKPRPATALGAGPKRSWNKSRPAKVLSEQQRRLEAARTANFSGEVEQISEDQLQRRIRSVEVAMASKEYHFLLEHKGHCGPGAEPMTPDPQDSALCSRRSWLQAVQIWREELRRLYLLGTEGHSSENGPEVASVASTEVEETQGSEVDDSTTVSDDASSAHWSSR